MGEEGRSFLQYLIKIHEKSALVGQILGSGLKKGRFGLTKSIHIQRFPLEYAAFRGQVRPVVRKFDEKSAAWLVEVAKLGIRARWL